MPTEIAYQIITDRIMALLEHGTVPWHKPWNGGEGGMPRNLVSGKPYRGINIFMLGVQGFASPYWLSFPKQVNDLGGRLQKGQHVSYVVFWKFFDTEEPQDDGTPVTRHPPLLRWYKVVNVTQCEGLQRILPPLAVPLHPMPPLAACEHLLAGMPQRPVIRHEGVQASYRPTTDTVTMPPREQFHHLEAYFSTLFHELGHSTGHETRLNRQTLTDRCAFGSPTYGQEELIAEMTAAYLCGVCGIANATVDNSAAYLQHWLTTLRQDKKLLVHAAAYAQKAADYIQHLPPPAEGV
jgi:antirestriction protein ArdC